MPSRLHSTPGPAGDGHVQKTSAAGSDIQTFTAPAGAKAFMVACTTTDCRITVDGQEPSSAIGLTIYNGQLPIYIPVTGSDVKAASTASANSVVDLLWLF